jgi:hypothetical protein
MMWETSVLADGRTFSPRARVLTGARLIVDFGDSSGRERAWPVLEMRDRAINACITSPFLF